MLGCVYRDHLETEETLEDQHSELGTNLQNKIWQFREEYLFGIVHSEPITKPNISTTVFSSLRLASLISKFISTCEYY